MSKKQIKLMVSNMSDDELIKNASEQHLLANDENHVGVVGLGLMIAGTLLIWTFIAPLILYPIGLLLMIFRPRKYHKIKNIMFKELRKRGYKIIIKCGYGINNCGVQFIKVKY